MKNRNVITQNFGMSYGEATNMLTNYEWAVMLRKELTERQRFTGDREWGLLSFILRPLNQYIEEMEEIERMSRGGKR